MDFAKQVCIWPNWRLFEFGVLPISPVEKLSYTVLKKILPYVMEKTLKTSAGSERARSANRSARGVSRLQVSYKLWNHIAVNKLQISESFGRLYFEQMLIFSKRFNQGGSKSLESHSVNPFDFMVLLAAQKIRKLSLKLAHSSSSGWYFLGEEWPLGEEGNDKIDVSSKQHSVLDQRHQFIFVKENLRFIADILTSPGEKTLSHAAIEALDSALLCHIGDKYIPLSALLPHIGQSCGYNKNTQECDSSKLVKWIDGKLVSPSTVMSERKTTLGWSIRINSLEESISRTARMYTLNTPPYRFKSSKASSASEVIAFMQVSRDTIVKVGEPLTNSTIKMIRCSHSFFYLLDAVDCVFVYKCKDTTLCIGAVSRVLILRECKNMKIIAPCSRVVVQKCESMTLHLLTPFPPVMVHRNQEVVLAPFNTYHPLLEHCLKLAGLSLTDTNCWSSAVDPGSQKSSAFSLMPPSAFNLFTVPFYVFNTSSGDANKHAGMSEPELITPHLPLVYQKNVELVKQRNIQIQKQLQQSGLSSDERLLVSRAVYMKFQSNLQSEGAWRELSHLCVNSGDSETL